MALPNIHGATGGLPQYMQREEERRRSTMTRTTTPTLNPQNFQEYYNAAYGGVPMGVDESALARLFNENVMAPGLAAGREERARRTGASNFAPNAGNEAPAAMRLRGQYGSQLMTLLAQAQQQGVQNRLSAIGGMVPGMLGGSTTTGEETVVEPNPRGRFGGFQQGGGLARSYMGGGGGGQDTGLDWYANMRPNQSEASQLWNAAQPGSNPQTRSWSQWAAY